MDYLITRSQAADEPPGHLLLLGDENQQLIDAYLPLSQVYLLTVEARVEGICVLYIQHQVGEIMNIAVEPAYQGKGLGKALLSHMIEVAKQQHLLRLVIKTGNSGIGQLALYQQQGFDLVHVKYNYFLQAYPKPIWENRIQCKHQLIFELKIS